MARTQRKYTDEQVVSILQEHHGGVTAKEIIRRHGVSPAPFDTFEATAKGRYNGVQGYPIHLILQDPGKPGGQADREMMEIRAPDGMLVLSVPWDVIVNGSIQAHYDQPRGNKP